MNRMFLLVLMVVFLTAYDFQTTQDQKNGLQWSQSISNEMAWEFAKAYCDKFNENELTDWALPTKKQLELTIDPTLKQDDSSSKERPYFNFFYTEEEGFIFSKTEVDGYENAPYVMRLVNAHIFNGQGRDARVRCVRVLTNVKEQK